MNRSLRALSLVSRRIVLARGAAVAALLPLVAAQAQMRRVFPQKVERAYMSFVQPPQVLLGDRPERLGPGTRIRDQHNRVVLPGTLRGKAHVVNYQRDAAGVIREIWILTPYEIEHDRRPLVGDDFQAPSH